MTGRLNVSRDVTLILARGGYTGRQQGDQNKESELKNKITGEMVGRG
jgi:hypothetical protein